MDDSPRRCKDKLPSNDDDEQNKNCEHELETKLAELVLNDVGKGPEGRDEEEATKQSSREDGCELIKAILDQLCANHQLAKRMELFPVEQLQAVRDELLLEVKDIEYKLAYLDTLIQSRELITMVALEKEKLPEARVREDPPEEMLDVHTEYLQLKTEVTAENFENHLTTLQESHIQETLDVSEGEEPVNQSSSEHSVLEEVIQELDAMMRGYQSHKIEAKKTIDVIMENLPRGKPAKHEVESGEPGRRINEEKAVDSKPYLREIPIPEKQRKESGETDEKQVNLEKLVCQLIENAKLNQMGGAKNEVIQQSDSSKSQSREKQRKELVEGRQLTVEEQKYQFQHRLMEKAKFLKLRKEKNKEVLKQSESPNRLPKVAVEGEVVEGKTVVQGPNSFNLNFDLINKFTPDEINSAIKEARLQIKILKRAAKKRLLAEETKTKIKWENNKLALLDQEMTAAEELQGEIQTRKEEENGKAQQLVEEIQEETNERKDKGEPQAREKNPNHFPKVAVEGASSVAQGSNPLNLNFHLIKKFTSDEISYAITEARLEVELLKEAAKKNPVPEEMKTKIKWENIKLAFLDQQMTALEEEIQEEINEKQEKGEIQTRYQKENGNFQQLVGEIQEETNEKQEKGEPQTRNENGNGKTQQLVEEIQEETNESQEEGEPQTKKENGKAQQLVGEILQEETIEGQEKGEPQTRKENGNGKTQQLVEEIQEETNESQEKGEPQTKKENGKAQQLVEEILQEETNERQEKGEPQTRKEKENRKAQQLVEETQEETNERQEKGEPQTRKKKKHRKAKKQAKNVEATGCNEASNEEAMQDEAKKRKADIEKVNQKDDWKQEAPGPYPKHEENKQEKTQESACSVGHIEESDMDIFYSFAINYIAFGGVASGREIKALTNILNYVTDQTEKISRYLGNNEFIREDEPDDVIHRFYEAPDQRVLKNLDEMDDRAGLSIDIDQPIENRGTLVDLQLEVLEQHWMHVAAKQSGREEKSELLGRRSDDVMKRFSDETLHAAREKSRVPMEVLEDAANFHSLTTVDRQNLGTAGYKSTYFDTVIQSKERKNTAAPGEDIRPDVREWEDKAWLQAMKENTNEEVNKRNTTYKCKRITERRNAIDSRDKIKKCKH